MSTRVQGRTGCWEQQVVDLADDVALEAADDLALGLALGGAPGDVVDGGLVEAHADDDGAVDRCIELAVPAVVDAVPPGGQSGAGGDRADPGELGQGGFGMDALGVVTGDDEDLGGGVHADAERLEPVSYTHLRARE